MTSQQNKLKEKVKEFLEEKGYRVLTANDGLDALALYKHHREEVRAALVDMWMPRMDGNATIKELLTLTPDLVVIAMSGLPTLKAEMGTSAKTRFEVGASFSLNVLSRTRFRGRCVTASSSLKADDFMYSTHSHRHVPGTGGLSGSLTSGSGGAASSPNSFS